MKAYNNWKAIRRAPVNHALTFIPKSQVSFNTSNVQNPHHIIRVPNMRFRHLSNFAFLTSIIASAMRMISNISLYKDFGMPAGKI